MEKECILQIRLPSGKLVTFSNRDKGEVIFRAIYEAVSSGTPEDKEWYRQIMAEGEKFVARLNSNSRLHRRLLRKLADPSKRQSEQSQ